MNKLEKDKLMFEGNVFKLVIKMAIPVALGMLFNLIYNLVDTFFICRIDLMDPSLIGGPSVVYPITFIAMALASGLNNGVSSIVARAIGEKKEKFGKKPLIYGLFLGFTVGTVVALIIYIFKKQIIYILGAQGIYFQNALTYINYIWPMFFIMMVFHAVTGYFQGHGDMKIYMILMIVGNVANIVLDPILIFGLNMGVKGAALATTIGNALTLFIGFHILFKRENVYTIIKSITKEDSFIIKEIVYIGFPQTLRLIIVSFMSLVTIKLAISVDPIGFSSLSILNRLEQLLYLPIWGVSFTLIATVGQNIGRKLYKRVDKIVNVSQFIGFTGTLFLSLLILIFSNLIFGLFTEDPTVKSLCIFQMKILLITFPLFVFPMITENFYQAIGKPLPSLWLMIFRTFIVFIPIALVTVKVMKLGLYGIYYSKIITAILCSIVEIICIKITMKKIKKI